MDFSIFKRIKQRYRQLYRFVIMDDATFQEKVVFRLTPRLFAILFVSLTVLLIVLTITLVAFTPLREYIPGYGSEHHTQKIAFLQSKTDSLDKLIAEITVYERDLKTLLTGGKFKDDTLNLTQKEDVAAGKDKFAFSEYDSVLMQVKTNRANVLPKTNSIHIKQTENKRPDLFFVPVNGTIQQRYSSEFKGVKISCAKGSDVFASLAGTVIYVGYGLKTGTCIVILHPGNIVTVYQRAGKSAVRTGDYVKPKQVISTTDSDILLFELWINGIAVKPEEYILF